MLLAAAAEPRTWDGIWALVIGYVGFRIVAFFWRQWREASPTPPAIGAGSRPKVQATVGVSDGDTDVDTWWGRIVEHNGVRFRQARQILKTGSHEIPADPDEGEGDIDVALADDEEEEEPGERRKREMREYINNADQVKVPYNHIVKILMSHYGVSERTAKRRIADVREERKAQSGGQEGAA